MESLRYMLDIDAVLAYYEIIFPDLQIEKINKDNRVFDPRIQNYPEGL